MSIAARVALGAVAHATRPHAVSSSCVLARTTSSASSAPSGAHGFLVSLLVLLPFVQPLTVDTSRGRCQRPHRARPRLRPSPPALTVSPSASSSLSTLFSFPSASSSCFRSSSCSQSTPHEAAAASGRGACRSLCTTTTLLASLRGAARRDATRFSPLPRITQSRELVRARGGDDDDAAAATATLLLLDAPPRPERPAHQTTVL